VNNIYRSAALVIAFSFAATLFAFAKDDAKTIYDTDTKKIRSGDIQFDWKEYRLASVTAGVGGSYDWHPVRNRFMQQLKDGDFQAALKSANDIQNHNMAEPEGHLLAMMAYQKMDRTQDATFEHSVVAAYLQSILSSGDGKSSKTAYFVVDEGEEYFFLNIVMNIGLPSSQALVEQEGHSFDKLTIKDKDGKDQEIWFNVDTSMNAMREALGEKSK
jgi:hypothetical protein